RRSGTTKYTKHTKRIGAFVIRPWGHPPHPFVCFVYFVVNPSPVFRVFRGPLPFVFVRFNPTPMTTSAPSRPWRNALAFLAAVLLSVFSASSASAAIAFDAAASTSGTNGASISWSHTVGAGANIL